VSDSVPGPLPEVSSPKGFVNLPWSIELSVVLSLTLFVPGVTANHHHVAV